MNLPEGCFGNSSYSAWRLKFRRQHPIGPFVADFYYAAAKLVVEVDGISHEWAAGGPMTPGAPHG
jgi:hypothetical protein